MPRGPRSEEVVGGNAGADGGSAMTYYIVDGIVFQSLAEALAYKAGR